MQLAFAEAHPEPQVRLRQWSLATSASRPDATTTFSLHQEAKAASEEVTLQVQDDVRGFTATTRIAPAASSEDAGGVVTIEAETTQEPAASTETGS